MTDNKMIRIALAGNPNSGKTTLFNALTGSNQFVGNWPGVTVEKKEGKQFDWEKQFDLALDPEKARAMRQEAIEERNSPTPLQGSRNGEHFCSMCGAKFCSIRVSKEI